MTRLQLIRISLSSVIANKLRTVLSMLGVIIGVITIMLVNAIGTGAKQVIESQFKNLSVNTIFVFPMRGLELELEAVEAIKQVPEVSKAAGFYQSNTTFSANDNSSTNTIVGMTTDMFDIVSLKLLKGELLNETHITNKERVVILGNGLFTTLFPDTQAETVIGTTVLINKKEFTIIGILDKAGGSFGMLSIDESAYMPITTFEKVVVRTSPPLRIAAIAKTTKQVASGVQHITQTLNEMYKIEEGNTNALRVIDAGGSVATAQQNADTLTTLLVGIASIVFLVSGIGIMNVMFASVAERTKEIGILKSIGANRSSILGQFLLESLILTGFASLIGVAIGEGIIMSNILSSTLPMVRSNTGDITAVTFAMATGLFFGWYPAWRASLLDPVDALRS